MDTSPDSANSPGNLLKGLGDQQLPAVVADDFNVAMAGGLHPYNLEQRAQIAEQLFQRHQARFAQGSFERANFLLKVLHFFYPSSSVSSAYFDNLDTLLGDRPPLDQAGKVVLGLGTGRCGSTSLAAAFSNIDNALATHENPPMIFWEPRREQVEFHLKRLEFLSRYFPVVFDASHWWLKIMDMFFERFPDGKAVGLYRDMESCVASFLRIKGVERGTINHWAAPDEDMWRLNVWDPCYPSYRTPEEHRDNPLMVKGTQIQWYVDSYNRQLHDLADTYPERVLLVETKTLKQPEVSQALSRLVGLPVSIPQERYNADTMDSVVQQQSFLF